MPPVDARTVLLTALSVAAGSVWAQSPGTVVEQQPLVPDAGVDTDSESQAGSLRRVRDALAAVEEFASALGPAEELLAGLRSPDRRVLALDMLALADIRSGLQHYDQAAIAYLDAIAILANTDGEFSTTLIDPYHALGRNYIRAGFYQEAVVALGQAQHISQRNHGLFNVEQSALLDDLSVAHLGLGDTVEAQRLQIAKLENASRRFGPSDPRVLPFHEQLAEYHVRSRMPLSAREQYQRMIEVIEAHHGGADPRLLAPLREIVAIDLLTGAGRESRDRLEDLLGVTSDAAPGERALSFAVLGDWALRQRDVMDAAVRYRQAWAAAGGDSGADAPQMFGTPLMIDFLPPLSPVDRNQRSRPWSWGVIVLRFSVAEDGRPWNVEVVSADPPGQMESAYVRRLREATFRPRLVAGEPVRTDSVQVTHRFRYYADR
jgi:tetratricopeptide (TPR) repeat protein